MMNTITALSKIRHLTSFNQTYMAYLPWISDSALEAEVQKILDTAQNARQKAVVEFNKNVIDPFSVIFEMTGFQIPSVSDWERNEKNRQSQKTLSNTFGTFHQGILGNVQGWRDLGTGESADVESISQKIIAEIKNKFNTVKGSDLVNTYDHLESLVMPITSKYRGFTAYYVEIIPKQRSGKAQSYDEPFTPSDKATKSRRYSNEKIRKIDGKSFYAMVTGHSNALEQLYSVLPMVIKKKTAIQFHEDDLSAMRSYFGKAFS